MRIALLGVGLMGFPIGQRLCRAGHEVRAWNRSIALAMSAPPCETSSSASATAPMATSGAGQSLPARVDAARFNELRFEMGCWRTSLP